VKCVVVADYPATATLLIFVCWYDHLKDENLMKTVIEAGVAVLLSAAGAYLIYEKRRGKDDGRNKIIAATLLFLPAVLAMLVAAGAYESVTRLMVCLASSFAGLQLLVSSLWDEEAAGRSALWLTGLSGAIVIWEMTEVLGWCPDTSVVLDAALLVLLSLLAAGLFLSGIIVRLRDVKSVMKTGSIWANVALAVDAVYMLAFCVMVSLYVLAVLMTGGDADVFVLMVPLMFSCLLASMGVRFADGSLFVIWRRQERRIVESMKVTKVESASDPACIDDVYQEVYERIVAFFENEKPFLDSALTINEVVRRLYSNKLYVSKAISQYTGRNFCQFVNYYRVMYSMELFRNNPELRIQELASSCGFNSDVSYNMAFRLFMGETPGEWCRKERRRLIKLKK
jgi:AraC-like DNA-binding protein